MDLINIKTKEYPVTLTEFRKRFPKTPAEPSFKDFMRYGYALVRPTAQPDPGPQQYILEDAPVPLYGNSMYMQTWVIIDSSEEYTSHIDRIATLFKEMDVPFTINKVKTEDKTTSVLSIDSDTKELLFDEAGDCIKQDSVKTIKIEGLL